jgi:hypothetical protein
VLTIPANQDGGPPGGGGAGGATIDGEGASAPTGGAIKIMRKKDGDADFKEITEENNDVLPGEFMELKAEIPGQNGGTYEWAIGKKAIKNWIASSEKGEIVPISTSDMRAQNIHFYWHDIGQKEVTCIVKINGVVSIGYVRFDVKGLKSTGFTAEDKGLIKIRDNYLNPGTYLSYGGDENPGVLFTANVQVPDAFNQGTWNFVQTVKMNRAISLSKKGIDLTTRKSTQGDFFLDTVYPYWPEHPDAFATGVKGETEDQPGVELIKALDGFTINAYQINKEDFRMYLMFKPGGAKSIFVPLQVCTWYFQCSAKKDVNENWVLDARPISGKKVDSPIDFTDYPTWVKNAKDVRGKAD